MVKLNRKEVRIMTDSDSKAQDAKSRENECELIKRSLEKISDWSTLKFKCARCGQPWGLEAINHRNQW